MITIKAPAKINLTLEILRKRNDGYHEIRSVMQTIGLYDTIIFREAADIKYESDKAGWDPGRSLVSKAVELMRRNDGVQKGFSINVEKRIPLVGGLGGDSSDAAAILHGLNRLWKLGLSHEGLLHLAQQLGSDVSFFLYGGTALAEGRGELITPLPPIIRHWVVLVVPPIGNIAGKTEKLYSKIIPEDHTTGEMTAKTVEALKSGKGFNPSSVFNVFERVASLEFKRLEKYKGLMLESGAPDVHLAGSGPILFSLLPDANKSEILLARLKKSGLETYIVETTGGLE